MVAAKILHPYFPRDLDLPHYVPNDKNIVEILVPFFGLVVAVSGLTWMYTGKLKHMKSLPLQRLKMCWFMSCTLIHFVLEGYFSVFHKTLAGEQNFLAQIWKEYGKGDSRYVSGDPFIVCMEGITAFFDGPVAFFALLAFIRRSPNRYILQLVVSLCQIYGDVLYFITEIFEDFKHGEAYHPIYFWFYYFFMNAIWIVIPSLLVRESYNELCKVQTVADRVEAISSKKKH